MTSAKSVLGETKITTEDGITIIIGDGDVSISGVDVFDPSNAGKTYGPSTKTEVLDVRNGFADISNIAAAEKGYLLLAGSPDHYIFTGEYVNGLYSGLIYAKDNPWPEGPALTVSHAKGLIFEDGSTIYLPGSTTTETTPAYEEVTLQVDARLGDNPDGDESLSAITLSGFDDVELISILDKDNNPLAYTKNTDGTVTIHNVNGDDMEGIQVIIKVPDDVEGWDITASVDATKDGSEPVTAEDSVASSDGIVSSDDALTSLINDTEAEGWLNADTSTTAAHRESLRQTAGDDQETTDLLLLASADVSLSDVLGDVGSDQDMTDALDAVSDQHQLLQQIVDAGKQGTDVI